MGQVFNSGGLGVGLSLVPVFLLAAAAHADDVVVLDRGGGAARVSLAAEALGARGDVVLSPADAAAVDERYAADCTDAACYSRAGAAGSVALVVLVEAAHVAVVDVAAGILRRRPAVDGGIATVLAQLREPWRWGTLDTSALPVGSVVVVANNGTDAPYAGQGLAVGPLRVFIQDASGNQQSVEVLIVSDGAVVVTAPVAAAAPVVLDPPLHAGFVVAGVGGGVAGVGLVVALVGEAMFAAIPQDPVRAGDLPALTGAATTADVGFVIVGIGVVAAGAGVVWALTAASAGP